MDPFATLEFPQGRASYSGSVRCSDGGTESFCTQIERSPPLYGSWQSQFINQNDFDIDILRYGYSNKLNIDSTNLKYRVKLNDQDIYSVKELIIYLFEYISKNKFTIPFNLRNASFTGKINFMEDCVSR
jgi:hypothetical protein